MKNRNLHKYRFLLLLLGLWLPQYLVAQDASSTVSPDGMTRILGETFLWAGFFVAFAAMWAIYRLAMMLMEIQKIRLLQEHGMEVLEKVDLQIEAKESWWERLNKKAWKLVPMEKEKDIMLDHDYDGIKELDNILPPWWVGMFYASIVFAIGYFGYYHVGGTDWSSHQEWQEEMAAAEESVKAYLAQQSDLVDETNAVLLVDENELGVGEILFQNSCAVCHGKAGEGGVGPNLADEYWLHGGDVKDIFKTIKYGVPEKGMIAWQSQIRPKDIQRISSFIINLRGTNPPNAKEPQGEVYIYHDVDAKESYDSIPPISTDTIDTAEMETNRED